MDCAGGFRLQPVAYLGGGGLVRGPPPFGRTPVIIVIILGLFLAPYRDKIAATSDPLKNRIQCSEQMRFLAGNSLKCVCGAGELTALPQLCQPVYC